MNGVRKYFTDRAKAAGTDLEPYYIMPTKKTKPHYFHFRAFFYQHILISFVNTTYIWIGTKNLQPTWCATAGSIVLFLIHVGMYPLFASIREHKQIAD